MIPRSLLVVPILVCAAGTYAADQLVLGNQFLVKDPSTPAKRKIVVKGKDIGSADTVVGNPVQSGATLEVRAIGASSTSQTFPLPSGTDPSTGKPYWSGDATKGFKYKDPKGSAGAV